MLSSAGFLGLAILNASLHEETDHSAVIRAHQTSKIHVLSLPHRAFHGAALVYRRAHRSLAAVRNQLGARGLAGAVRRVDAAWHAGQALAAAAGIGSPGLGRHAGHGLLLLPVRVHP